MIFSHEVRWTAEAHLRHILKDYKGPLDYLLHQDRFNKFVELCTHRCNQLEMAGCVPSKWALTDFIQKAARYYGKVQLEKVGNQMPDPPKNVA